MRLQIVVAGSHPLPPVGECGGRFLAAVEEIGDKILILNPIVAVARLDRIVVWLGEFRIPERQIGVTRKRLPRAGRTVVRADFVDLKQNSNEAKQLHGGLRHLRQRSVFLPPGNTRLRHHHHSAATICAGSRMPTSSTSALREYSSMRSSIS